MNNQNDETFIIEALVYKPTVGGKPGRFVDLRWETTPKANGDSRKDLLTVVQLEETDSSGHPYLVTRAFNMLPRGRGKAEFRQQMESFLGKALTPEQLASFTKSTIVGKSVVVNYKTNHLGHVVFDNYTPPVKPAEGAAS